MVYFVQFRPLVDVEHCHINDSGTDQQCLQTPANSISFFCSKGQYMFRCDFPCMLISWNSFGMSEFHPALISLGRIKLDRTGSCEAPPVLRGVAWKEASLKWLFWLVSECILEWKALIITHCYIQHWLTSNPYSLRRNKTYISVEFGKLAKQADH